MVRAATVTIRCSEALMGNALEKGLLDELQ